MSENKKIMHGIYGDEQDVRTLVLGARPAMRAAAAFPALFSSMKLMVALIISSTVIPTKSCQSGGLP